MVNPAYPGKQPFAPLPRIPLYEGGTVLACYVDMDPRTRAALEAYADSPYVDLEFVYVGNAPTDYWHAIADRWTGETDLIVIEQDIEIHEGVIESLLNCGNPWCSFWYNGPPAGMIGSPAGYNSHMAESLGCTKFSAELQAEIPHQYICDYDTQLWDTIDGKMAEALHQARFTVCEHGQVRHLHQYEMIYLDPPGPWRRFTWRHIGKEEYPSYDRKPVEIPEGAERVIIDLD